jgi:hypothetical protein
MVHFNSSGVLRAFDRLVENMACISPPPLDTCEVPETIAPALSILHQQFTAQFERTVKDIEMLRRAWSCLHSVARPVYDTSASSPTSCIAEVPTLQFSHTLSVAQNLKEEKFMRKVFDHHAGSKGLLCASELLAALKEVEAPVVASASSSAAEAFLRSEFSLGGETSMGGDVREDIDFAECDSISRLSVLFNSG